MKSSFSLQLIAVTRTSMFPRLRLAFWMGWAGVLLLMAMPAAATSMRCPHHGVRPSFHDMLMLPVRGMPSKTSFRSFISRTNETTIADITGPGCVKQLWLVTGTGSANRPGHCVYTEDSLKMVIRIYYDGQSSPSVEAPLGALFGIFHARNDSWGNLQAGYGADNSLFKLSENGGFTIMAPMPFSKQIRITLQYEVSEVVKMRVWAQTSYMMYDPRCPFPETLRLHALYRMEDRMVEQQPQGDAHNYKRSYELGYARGSGFLLGATLGIVIEDTKDAWYHNGGEMIIVDHTTNPQVLKGTGGEDFFGSSCDFVQNHNFADWGFLYGDNHNSFGAYRFFTHFQMPFASELQFLYGANRNFMQSVMLWYQREPALPAAKGLPPPSQRLRKAPSDPSLRIPAPTGAFTQWNLSESFKLDAQAATMLEPRTDESFAKATGLQPTFGFLSLGEYFFRYRTNENYPTNQAAWLRGTYVHRGAEGQSATLIATHDDPLLVRMNGAVVYSALRPLAGFHTTHAQVVLRSGVNVFEVKVENTENINNRAWVFGLDLRLPTDKVPVGMFGSDVYVQQRAWLDLSQM